MSEESFAKQIYTLEDLAHDVFWRDLGSKDSDSIDWNKGLWAEQERLRLALSKGVVINNDWCNEDFRIPRTLTHGMYEYLKGANEFRRRVGVVLNYGENFTNAGACDFYSSDVKYQQRPVPDYIDLYFKKKKRDYGRKESIASRLRKEMVRENRFWREDRRVSGN